MGNILHKLEAAEDDALLAHLRSEVARLQALADRRGEIAVDRKREIERLRLTDAEREAIERGYCSLLGVQDMSAECTRWDAEAAAVLRGLLERLGPSGHQE